MKKADKKDSDSAKKIIAIDWDNLTERKSRLTLHTSPASDWALSKDGEKLFYLTRFEKGNDIWLRLHNNSCWEIELTAYSMYITKTMSNDDPPKPKIIFGVLQDNTQAGIFYAIEENDRRQVPFGGDSFSMNALPSGSSVLFSVLKEHLSKGRSIYVPYTYAWEKKNFGDSKEPLHRSFFWGYRLKDEK